MKHGDVLSMHNEYSALNLADLLLARERNHVELMRKAHVVGTAVGLYLIRKSDPWGKKSAAASGARKGPRTLQNSEVRDYSWPCILVFVDEWHALEALDWEDRIPRAVSVDDTRKAPVCVVYAPKSEYPETPIRPVVYPSSRIGGGFPLTVEVQGQEHIASIGCLVRDGHTVYALTNRHVTGPAGEIVYGRFGGAKTRIGVSSSKQLTRLPFTKLYPGFAGKETYAHLDIGLVRIDNVNDWTTDVYGIGAIGPLADLGIDNLSLRLIDCPVRAYGCGSGKMRGRIKALFYRYKSMGGFEYVSDFLIGPREGRDDLRTHPGDSGTVWLLESPKQGLMPIAVQWGGQVFSSGGDREQSSYALATCLSTVCNILDVDVVRDWNAGVTEYWGEVGHYTIGALACTLTFTGLPGLERLMSKNITQVGFEPSDLRNTDKVLKNKAHYTFVPLADVADDVWRNTRKSGSDTNDDGNNHFADMDEPASSGKYKGQTLLGLCANTDNVDPGVWIDFYAGVSATTKPGALPFRVWQGYDLMVKALQNQDVVTFLCAAGTTAHYVGDACQPLHISRFHHGDPDKPQTSVTKAVHSVYETQMLNAHAGAIVDGVVAALKNESVSGSFTGGKGAAIRVVTLMRQTVTSLPPKNIVDAYNKANLPADRLTTLWDNFSTDTIALMAQGCICMADIWASAWKDGGGEQIPQNKLTAIDPQALSDLYNRADFFPSMALKLMVPLLTRGSAPAAAAMVTRTTRTKRSAGPRTKKKRARPRP